MLTVSDDSHEMPNLIFFDFFNSYTAIVLTLKGQRGNKIWHKIGEIAKSYLFFISPQIHILWVLVLTRIALDDRKSKKIFSYSSSKSHIVSTH